MAESNYDLAIVGAGLAGGVLAGAISQHGVNPRTGEPLRIALLELGPYLKGTPKSGYGVPLRRQLFSNVTHEFRSGGRYTTPRGGGALVGGSSMHFGAFAFLPSPVDHRAWQNETGLDWTEQNLESSVEEIKKQFHVHKQPEGAWTAGHRLFRQAAGDLGYTVHTLRSATKNCLYCGFCGDGRNMCKYDAKMSSLMNYIPMAEKNGVEILDLAEVKSIILEGTKTVGVNYTRHGQNLQLLADKVIVSAGGNTPHLLLASGYGRRDLLGARLLVENPNIGRHGDGRVRWALGGFFAEAVREGDRGWGGSAYVIDDRDPLYGEEQIMVFDQGFGDAIEPHRLALHDFAPPFGRTHKDFMRKKGSNFGYIDILCYKLKGPRVEITTSGTSVRKNFENYLPALSKRLNEGVEIALSIMGRMGPSRTHISPSERRMSRAPGGSHGLCRAGVERKDSVVNQFLESHDIENLFVCDGTVLPRKPAGNDSMTTASVARFAAQRIVERHFRN